jgi:catechol 2,3-dioxygenase-like lactoylglutathione lyase family enzyme
MLANASVMAFVATADAARSRAFYEETLGLKLLEDDMFALVFDLNGIMLRVQKVGEVVIAPYTALGWQVNDIAAEVRALAGRGVSFLRFDGMGQDELGVWNAPGGAAKVAWFKDPDGHTLSLTQF